jgi:DnaD/phage-associated family protein
MSGYILHREEQSLVLPHSAVERLVQAGDGDAALLYLLLMREATAVTPETLMRRLRWSELRLAAAETALQQMGLLQAAAERMPPEPAEERQVYTTADVAQMLQLDEQFRMLVPQTEEKLGKRLKTADLQILAGLYDDLGFSADVLYLLVNHCVTRAEKRYGLGRRPTMRQIEKEAYYWARLGIFTQEAAAEYLKKCAERDEQIQHYMYALGLGNRRAVETEERYIRSWIDMGFTVDAVALAYDKTVIYKKELNWRYLNGILRRWHEKGWHTAEEINRGDAQPKKTKNPADDGMDKYLDW